MADFNFPSAPNTNDLYTLNGITYRYDGSRWRYANASVVTITGGNAVTTFNSLQSSNQDFAVGYSGSTLNISSSGNTHTFNIPLAGNAITGLVSGNAQTIYGVKTFNSDFIVSSSTGSTNATTGAFIVTGGVGIGGTLVNGVGFGTTNNGYFIFDGSNDYINFGNSSTVQQSSGTLSAWVRASSPGAFYRGIIAKQGSYGLFFLNGVLIAYDWTADLARTTEIDIADNTWKNVVLTYRSGVSNGTQIYLNGISVMTTTITVLNQNNNLFGGAEANANQNAACQISSFNMYNRALTAQEVLQNYNATKGRYR